MSEYQYVEHEFAPVYNEESQVLVLGSLPSVKSREQGFYYGHPRNRFWKVVAAADIKSIVAHTPIRAVFTNGKTAGRLYKKYQAEHIALPMIELPSTSPANAAFSLEQLEEIWKSEIGKYL